MSADKASIKWREDERVLIQQDNASWGKSNTENLVGKLYLTTYSLVFIEDKAKGLFSFFSRLFSPSSSTHHHTIDFSQIATIRRGSLGLNKNVLHVSTADDIRYIYILNADVQDWIDAFQKASQ